MFSNLNFKTYNTHNETAAVKTNKVPNLYEIDAKAVPSNDR
jgi:hypothetical protein